MEWLKHALHAFVVYEANGFLVTAYTFWEHLAAVLTLASVLYLLREAPKEQRPWIAGIGLLSFRAALLGSAPAPAITAAMALAGAVAVKLDRYNPDSFRWRAMGGLALYALATLGYLAYRRYLAGMEAEAWAAAIGGQGEAQRTLAQGKSFVETLANWGLWLILPLGYFSLLVQALLVHPPTQAPEGVISTVRTRGRGR